VRLLILAIAALSALSGCSKTQPPGDAPTGVQAVNGDGLIVVQWDMLPDLTYWIFYEPGNSVAVATPQSIAIRNVTSPQPVINLINGIQYAFVMNATHADSAAGPSSIPVVATPRLAGGPGTWTTGTPLPLGAPQNLRSIAFSGTRFVAVGDAATVLAGDFTYTNVDPNALGVTAWVPATSLPVGFTADLSSVIYNGTFVALGTDGSIISSTDGLTWTANAQIPATGMNGLAFGLASGVPTYFAVGNGGAIFATTNLATAWTLLTSGTASDLTSISALPGSFLVTGAGGTLLTSQDGSNWAPLTSNTSSTLRSAVFNPNPLVTNRYVAVGDAGTIVSSSDGTLWNPIPPSAITPPLSQNLRSVTVGGATASRFLAVGQGGAVAYSDDGLNWLSASAGLSNNLAKVLFVPGMYLAVGDAGANAVSK
jgi:hypothetical protein